MDDNIRLRLFFGKAFFVLLIPLCLQRGGRSWSSVTIFAVLKCRLQIDQSPAGFPAGLSFLGRAWRGARVETLHATSVAAMGYICTMMPTGFYDYLNKTSSSQEPTLFSM